MATQAHNLDALMLGTGEFLFSEGAKTAAAAAQAGFIDFSNVKMFEIQPEDEELEHIGSYRGVRRIDKRVTTRTDLKYQVVLDELTAKKFVFAFFGTQGTDHSQSSYSTANGTPLAFSAGSPSVSDRWYPLLDSTGVQVRRLTAVTVATLTEGTDFEVDYEAGMIRFLTAQSASRTPVLSAPALSNTFKTITPLQRATREGIVRLRCWDNYVQTSSADVKSKLVFEHLDFGATVTLDGNLTVDGEQWAELTLMIQVTNPVGTIFVRE